MAAALEPVDRHRVAPDRLRLQRMAHAGALVDHPDPRVLQIWKHRLRIVACGLDHRDPAFDDRADIARIVGRVDRGQEGQVHAEGLVGHVPAARDLVRKVARRLLREPGNDPEPARIRHRRGHFGQSDEVHPALDDRMLDPEHFGNRGLHGVPSCGSCRGDCRNSPRVASQAAGFSPLPVRRWRRAIRRPNTGPSQQNTAQGA